MSIADEQCVRLLIEQMIADRDAAFVQGNTRGILGHFVPYDRRREEDNYRLWAAGMDWTEDRASESTITQFELDGERALVEIEQKRRICFRQPLPVYALFVRLLLCLLSKFVIVERQVNRTEWVKSDEGWLCHSEKRLSYRTRLRLRRQWAKPVQPMPTTYEGAGPH